MPKKLTKVDVLRRLDQINTNSSQKVFLSPKTQPYVNQSTKMQFKCENNHTWTTTTSNIFARNSKCPHCKLSSEVEAKRTPWEELLQQFESIHGEYTYDKTSYVNSKTPIAVTCKKHGDFSITPYDHKNLKRGCPTCRVEEDQRIRLQKYIDQCNRIHGNKYDYTKVEYVNGYTPVTIVCPTHGEFTQRLDDHSHGYGCKQCSGSGISRKSVAWLEHLMATEGEFIQHAGNTGEYRIPGTRYSVDGYCKNTNTVYEFHGDAFHGNPSRYDPSELCNPYDKNITAGELYENTIRREIDIKSRGYDLVVLWESEFDTMGITVDVKIDTQMSRSRSHELPVGDLNTIKLELMDADFKGYKHKHQFKCLCCGSPFTTTLSQRMQGYRKRGTVGCPACQRQGNVTKVLTDMLTRENIEYTVEDNVILLANTDTGVFVKNMKANDRQQLVDLQQMWRGRNIEVKIIFTDEITKAPNLVLSKIKHYCGGGMPSVCLP